MAASGLRSSCDNMARNSSLRRFSSASEFGLLLRLFLETPAHGDVSEQNRDVAQLRRAQPEGVDVEPSAVECPRLVHESNGFARQCDAAVRLEPMRLEVGHQCAHAFADCIAQPGLLLEGRVGFQKSEVHGTAASSNSISTTQNPTSIEFRRLR